MVWLEVETKVKLNSKEIPKLKERILEIANFEKKGKKGDDYFALKRKGYPKKAFRIRKTKDHFEVNFKKWLKKYWTKEIVVKKEYEFKIYNKEEIEDLLELFRDLGFVEWVKKLKKNETYKHKKDKRISIELNKVKHLGWFMEIEYLCRPSEMKRARKKILNTLKELKIDFSKINNTGYTKMLWDKGIKDRKYFID